MRNRTKLLTAWKLLVVACLSLVQPAWAYYNPSTGRWLNRDPIGERGGPNLTAFVANRPISRSDALGLRTDLNPRDLRQYKICRRANLNERLTQGGVGPGDYKQDCCQKITVIIKLPLCTAGGLEGKGMGGHTAVGIEDEFYDYGPDNNNRRGIPPAKGNFLTGVPGYQWWDNPGRWDGDYSADDIGLSDVLGNIADLASERDAPLDVFKIEIAVSETEARDARAYWRALYSDLGTYSLLGDQCTTTVMKSLDRAGIFERSPLTFKPIGFLRSLESATHTCGPNKGRRVRFEHINKETAPSNCRRP